MEASKIVNEQLADVPEADRPRLVAAAVGLAFSRIERERHLASERLGALATVLSAASEEVADGPQSVIDARTPDEWMREFLARARPR